MCDNRQIFKLKQTNISLSTDPGKNIWGEPSYVIRLPERHILDLNKKVPRPGRRKRKQIKKKK
jgi:hypothetical protein